MKTAEEFIESKKYIKNEPFNVSEKDWLEAMEEYANEKLEEAKAGQHETIVTRLEERKRHWHDVSRGILVGDIEEDEFKQQDAIHMYGCYIDVVFDMRTLLKNKNG